MEVIVTGSGYHSAGAGKPYRPYVFADARLVSTQTGEVLMNTTIFYNPPPNPPNPGVGNTPITVPPDPNYGWDNIEKMEADAPGVVEGMVIALTNVAAVLAKLLR